MLRKFFVIGALGLFLLPAAAKAQFDEADWEMTLTGSGISDDSFDTTSLSVNVGLGYFFTDALEAGIRQSLAVSDSDFGSSWAGTTTLFGDYHFDLDRWQPFVGAFIGYSYGDDVDESWVGGPEGGVKYFVNSTTFIFGQIQYAIQLDDSDADDAFIYALGIGFKW